MIVNQANLKRVIRLTKLTEEFIRIIKIYKLLKRTKSHEKREGLISNFYLRSLIALEKIEILH